MMKKRGWILVMFLLVIGYATAWSITLNNPDGYVANTYTGGNVTFSYSVGGADYPAAGTDCTLWSDINGTWFANQTDSGVFSGATSTNLTLPYNIFTEWNHIWNINCTNGTWTNMSASNGTYRVDFLTYGTHLNISILEKVDYLALWDYHVQEFENDSFFNVTGTINISNLEDETISDIYIVLTDTYRLRSNFTNISGKSGSQVMGTWHSWNEYGKINDTLKTTLEDLDDDGTADEVYLNSTHLHFNLTSIGIINISMKSDLSGANITPVGLSINETAIKSGGVIYGYVQFSGTTNVNDTILAANTFRVIENDEIWLHIPELRRTNYTTFSYWLKNSTFVTPPLNIITEYTHTESPKVLADQNFTVTSTVQNEVPTRMNITDIIITEVAQNVTWNSSNFKFIFYNTSVSGDYNNSVTVESNQRWVWVPNNGSGWIDWNTSFSISWTIKAPASVPMSRTYNASIAYLSYRLTDSLSNMTIKYVNATAEIRINLEKKVVSPLWGIDHNVTWRVIPSITTPKNMSFNLLKNTMWVTRDLDPNNSTTFSNISVLSEVINISSGWTGPNWNFNFTDGSNGTYPPPIVWMKPIFQIRNDGTQIKNYSATWNNSDRYVKAIYIINGYWLEVWKNVTNVGNDTYFLFIEVKNIGNGYTPQNQLVTVYDFVPTDFTAWGFDPSASANQAVGNATASYYGTAYRWDIPFSWTGANASLAPDDDAPGGADEWNATYYVNGSGDYRVTDLYIVGLDPRAVDGANTVDVIAVVNSLRRINTERIYALIVLVLIVLNVTNLVMTSRINKKI